MKMLSALFLSAQVSSEQYEDKDSRDLESTLKLRGVEVKIRPCIHKMDLTTLY